MDMNLFHSDWTWDFHIGNKTQPPKTKHDPSAIWNNLLSSWLGALNAQSCNEC